MNKPILSSNFTVDDIHKLREYNYEVTKEMSNKDKMKYYNNKGKALLKELDKIETSV